MTQERGADDASEDRDAAVARLVAEYEAALQAGRPVPREEFLGRHPAHAAALAECLEGLEFLHRVAPPSGGTDETPVPETLGDFRIVGEIARGGMGVVYEAEQVSLGRRVALKVLAAAANLDSRHLARFQNEAQVAARLHHSHIVPVFAVGCDRGVHYYAMEFIEGLTLAEVVAELRARRVRGVAPRPMRPSARAAFDAFAGDGRHESEGFCRSVARAGLQAAAALEHAHARGVVHRDIKPANLMVDRRGDLWVTDFGLAFVRTNPAGLTRTGDLLGTLRYMSPELTQGGKAPVDHRTDVYSLGLALYEVLTLERAFAGSRADDLIRAIRVGEPRPARSLNGAVPPDLETVLAVAMAKGSDARYASAQEMGDDLARFLQGLPVRARRPDGAPVTWNV